MCRHCRRGRDSCDWDYIGRHCSSRTRFYYDEESAPEARRRTLMQEKEYLEQRLKEVEAGIAKSESL